jgi:para-nitrobenzyl esterase
MAHPELTAESPDHASGNYGILDCIAAVKWVRENVASFGGDPARVTIAGQSAGARAVHVLIASTLARGDFSGAIAISGSSIRRLSSATPLAEAEKTGLEFGTSKDAKTLAALRALDPLEIIKPLKTPIRFPLVIDGLVLGAPEIEVFEKGLQNDVPMLTGVTADDAMSPATKTTRDEYIERAKKNYGEQYQDFLSLYPVHDDHQASLSLVESAREQNKVATFQWAAFKSRTARTPTYTYYFDQAIPWPEHPEFGAFHTGDVPYFFNNLRMIARPWTSTDLRVAQTASDYLVNFVKTGNPNGPGLPLWDAFSSANRLTMHLGETIRMDTIAAGEKIAFFELLR